MGSSDSSDLEFTPSHKSKGNSSKKKSMNKKPSNSNSCKKGSASKSVPATPAGNPAPEQNEVEFLSSESEDSSSDGEGGYGKQQALGIDPVEIENYDGTSAPQNGSQYLLSVIQETKKSPKVVVADAFKNGSHLSAKTKAVTYLDSFQKEVHCDVLLKVKEGNPYCPSLEWREERLKDFSALRSKVEQLRGLISTGATRIRVADNFKFPETRNKVVWLRFCFGIRFEKLVARPKEETDPTSIISTYFQDLKIEPEKVPNPQVKETVAAATEIAGSPTSSNRSSATSTATSDGEKVETCNLDGCKPLMSLMLLLSQQQILELISYTADWIGKYGFVNKCQGEWLYALLACVEKPLEPSSMAAIRMICKSLIIIRNNFTSKISNEDVVSGAADGVGKSVEEKVPVTVDMKDLSIVSDFPENLEYINALNLFIYLIADYFSQKDLVMDLS